MTIKIGFVYLFIFYIPWWTIDNEATMGFFFFFAQNMQIFGWCVIWEVKYLAVPNRFSLPKIGGNYFDSDS
jgi:hypothetical protein